MKGRTVLSWVVALGVAAGCSSGSSSSGGAGVIAPAQSGQASIVFTSVPADGLFLMPVSITSMQLRDGMGTLTANLLPASRTAELAGLEGLRSFFARLDVPVGTYDAVVIGFDAQSLVPYGTDGLPIPGVTVITSSATFPLDVAMIVSSGSTQIVEVVWDLFDSVTFPAVDQADFAANGAARILSAPVDVEEIRGRVSAVDVVLETFDVDWAGCDAPVRAALASPAYLLDENGTPFTGKQPFLASLSNGDPIELRGSIQADGSLLVDAAERQGSYAEVEGTIVSIDAANGTMTWLQRAVEYVQGAPWPALETTILRQAPMASNLVVQDKAAGATLGLMDLQPGMTVDLVLESFGSGWMVASAELDRFEQALSGRIVRVLDAGEMIVALHDDDPIAMGNWVNGQVRVRMDQASVRLSMMGRPDVPVSDLVPGTRVHLRGWLQRGSRNGSTLASAAPGPGGPGGPGGIVNYDPPPTPMPNPNGAGGILGWEFPSPPLPNPNGMPGIPGGEVPPPPLPNPNGIAGIPGGEFPNPPLPNPNGIVGIPDGEIPPPPLPNPNGIPGIPGAEYPTGAMRSMPHVFDAYEVNVDPGLLSGVVTSVQSGGTLTLLVQQESIPFGPAIMKGGLQVSVDADAEIEDGTGAAVAFGDLMQDWIDMTAQQDLMIALRGHVAADASLVAHDVAYQVVDANGPIHTGQGGEAPDGWSGPPGPEPTFPNGSIDPADGSPRTFGPGNPPGKGGPVGDWEGPPLPPIVGVGGGPPDDGSAPRPTWPENGNPGLGDYGSDRPRIIADPYDPWNDFVQTQPGI